MISIPRKIFPVPSGVLIRTVVRDGLDGIDYTKKALDALSNAFNLFFYHSIAFINNNGQYAK
jgi:hypothetical protein